MSPASGDQAEEEQQEEQGEKPLNAMGPAGQVSDGQKRCEE